MQTKSIFYVSVLIGACNPQIAVDTLGTTTEMIEYLCVPGESIECGCENGLEGAQKCQGDGQAFGECFCEEPSTTGDSSSTGSTSEEEIVCEAGEMDACACDLETVGTKICTDSNEWGECFCKAENKPTTPPHFILRNNNNKVVNAMFTPLCAGDNYAACVSSIDESSFPCVYIEYLESNPIWLAFDLISGQPNSCYPNLLSWYDLSYEVVFDNENCSGTPLALHGFGLRPNLDVIRVLDKMYWADSTKNSFPLKNSYQYLAGECTLIGASEVFKIEELPVPIKNILDNAPYSIHIE